MCGAEGGTVEVLVVGGGPAGLSAARAVAATGHETLVVERQPTVGEHVRTSGVTALDTTERLGAPAELRHEVDRIRFCTREDEVVVDLERRRLCVLDVRSFYRWLARLAEDAGACVETDTAVTGIRRTDAGLVECRLRRSGAEDAVLLASVVVDASSYRASVSRQAGLHGGFERFGVGAEYELEAPLVSQEEAVLVLDENIAPTGYAWRFRGARATSGSPSACTTRTSGTTRECSSAPCTPMPRRSASTSAAARCGVPLRAHSGRGASSDVRPDGLVAVGDAAGHGTLVVGEGSGRAFVRRSRGRDDPRRARARLGEPGRLAAVREVV